MMKTIWLEDIGEVNLVRSKRAKNIRISIKPLKGVTLTYPYFSSKRNAIRFLEEKKTWIKKNLLKVKKIENQKTIFNSDTIFNTYEHQLTLKKWNKETYRITRENGVLEIKYPESKPLMLDEVQQRIRKEIEKTWKIEAEKYFPKAFNNLASKNGFNYQSLVIKNVKSKWGSCSHKNDIILSLHLMRLPKHLIKYVMLHELCHTLEKNHQAPFWNLMNKVTNNQARILDKELKNYSAKIY
jgi:predicted metal-dependent hydrolase